jgi:hypothetical protein
LHKKEKRDGKWVVRAIGIPSQLAEQKAIGKSKGRKRAKATRLRKEIMWIVNSAYEAD